MSCKPWLTICANKFDIESAQRFVRQTSQTKRSRTDHSFKDSAPDLPACHFCDAADEEATVTEFYDLFWVQETDSTKIGFLLTAHDAVRHLATDTVKY